MSAIEKTLESMFQASVGTDEARQNYTALLQGAVAMARMINVSPFTVIFDMLRQDMTTTLASLDHRDPSIDEELLVSNANLGRYAHLQSLKTVAGIYKNNAEAPQRESSVRKSVDATTKHIFGIAFSGSKKAGFYNLGALADGVDPASPIHAATTELKLLMLGKSDFEEVAEESFVIEEQAEGQLLITPRYEIYRSDEAKFCPATGMRIQTPDGLRSALFMSMQLVGDVVVEEIILNNQRAL